MDAIPSDSVKADPAIVAAFARGWAQGRHKAPPVADGDGWRIEVGWPEQTRRTIFADLSPHLRALGQSIEEPWVMLKACVWPEAMAAALPPRWSLDPLAHMLTLTDLGERAPILPPGYRLTMEEATIAAVRVRAPDDSDAASGIVTISDGYAVHNSIRTDPAHRRRGLGSAVMAALGRLARDRGAARGLLSSTADGLKLYTALGWDYHMPYTTAVIRG